MSQLTEAQARWSETELLRGHINRLAQGRELSADQRIGVCLALKVLDARMVEHERRRKEGV